MDFIYERFKTPARVKIEEITGGSRYKGKVWREIAMQIYCENGKEGYREVGHFASGAPFLYDADERISISHTEGCLVVATIPVSADSNLQNFSPATALGVDVERDDRDKVMNLRERFLSADELKLVDPESITVNIIAWTAKEAMLKAYMDPMINWHEDIVITALPSFETNGEGYVKAGESRFDFRLHSIHSDSFIITVATAL